MNAPFSLPDWLPWWAIIVILVPVLLYVLAFLVMPFNVFGLRSRLDVIDARLDEIQGEIRALAVRLPEPSAGARGTLPSRPPIPPAPPTSRRPARWSEPEDEAPGEMPEEQAPYPDPRDAGWRPRRPPRTLARRRTRC